MSHNHGLSIRQKCKTLQVSRVGYYRFLERSKPVADDIDLRDQIQRIALQWPSYGYRRITAELKRRGKVVNRTGSVTASYKYDYLGRRFSKTVNSVTSTYIYEGQNLIAERGAATVDYVFGSGIDEPLALTSGGSSYDYSIDGLGSISAMTTTTGTLSRTYTYDAWGIIAAQTGSFANPFTYTARESSEVGLMYYRARYYNPGIGRFVSEDPMRWKGGTNWFSYVFSNSLYFIDPWGLPGVTVEVGVRRFFGWNGWAPPPPYMRHCFIRFNNNNNITLSFDDKGVHSDPNPEGGSFYKTRPRVKNLPMDENLRKCIFKEMYKCTGGKYDFNDFNCCHCVSNALYHCGLELVGDWPNSPYDASNPPYNQPK